MIDIYCEDNLCPICSSKLNVDKRERDVVKYCNNRCYYAKITPYDKHIKATIKILKNEKDIERYSTYDIFNIYSRNSPHFSKTENNYKTIEQRIGHWRKNERYLTRLLENGGY